MTTGDHFDELETRDPAARETALMAALRQNEDVKEFYLGISASGRKSYRDTKHYKRRKRWLA